MCRVPLTLTHELDPYIRKDLKPFLFQTPTFYNKSHQLNGLAPVNNKIYVLDTFGALYETGSEQTFPAFESKLVKEDQLTFEVNGEMHFTYDLLNVEEVYDSLMQI